MIIPQYIKTIITTLTSAHHEAFIVGGCVRDLLLGKEPQDWDITTNAKPEEVLALFSDAKYENVFGTVIIPIKEDSVTLDAVEVTTYRSERGYSDRRHPDEIVFEDKLEKDLSRRDFTINAMALSLKTTVGVSAAGVEANWISEIILDNEAYELVDLFGGQKDLKKKMIRAVGEPEDRFKEDALRMMRAIRFSCQLGFEIEEKTQRSITKLAGGIKFIAFERIRDELVKILKSDRAYEGVSLLHEVKILQYVIPELERGVGMEQNKHHIYNVFHHLLMALKYCPTKDWRVRFAALLHDIGKPATIKKINGENTFYNHDLIGARMTKKICQRLHLSNEDADKIITLVRYHMFYYNVGEVTEASVRRLIVKVGEENLQDLIDLRIADRLGSGVPKAKPYKLRHLEYMLEKVRHDPVSVKMLAIDGSEIMSALQLSPGPKIGALLDVLLSEVIEDPLRNAKEHLLERAMELAKLEMKDLRQQAKAMISEKRDEDDLKLKKGFFVK